MRWDEREASDASKRSLDKPAALREKVAQMKAQADKKRERDAATTAAVVEQGS